MPTDYIIESHKINLVNPVCGDLSTIFNKVIIFNDLVLKELLDTSDLINLMKLSFKII